MPLQRDGPAPTELDIPKPPATLGDSKVSVFKTVTSLVTDARGRLDAGSLLQFMDIAACLSAEQHCKLSCVTLSMDDLFFEAWAPLGVTIRLDAQITKVFGTSMEVGVSVVIEPQTARQRASLVCSACFIFVAMKDGKAAKGLVEPAIAANLEERCGAALAEERRKWMKKRLQLESEAAAALQSESATLQSEDVSAKRGSVLEASLVEVGIDLLTSTTSGPGGLLSCCNSAALDVEGGDPSELAEIQLDQLVLPHHANHHGNTFGGQLMSWMAEAATIAACRQARSSLKSPAHVTINVFDAMKFIAPSSVGDRVRLLAKATRVFDDASIEISVDVLSAAVGAEAFTPINSGFLTVSLVEQRTGRALRLPPSQPIANDASSAKRHEAAMVRRQLRIQRRQMFSSRPDAFHFASVRTLLEELRICNVMALLRAAHSPAVEWELLLRIGSKQHLKKGERRGTMLPGDQAPAPIAVFISMANTSGAGAFAVKAEAIIHAPVTTVFDAVSDYEKRVEWDPLMEKGSKVIEKLDEHTSLTYLLAPPLARGFGKSDYALMQSWQKDEEDGYVIASRSVVSDQVPSVPGVNRNSVLPSGFLLEPVNAHANATVPVTPGRQGASTRLIYVVQITPKKGLTGLLPGSRIRAAASQLMVRRMVALQVRLAEDGQQQEEVAAGEQAAGEQEMTSVRSFRNEESSGSKV